MPQRHSKNNNDLAFFTYDEKRKLGYGTQKERLGKDSIKPFDACSLCLKPFMDPLCCQKGHVFCKECILECLLSQKKDIQRYLFSVLCKLSQLIFGRFERKRCYIWVVQFFSMLKVLLVWNYIFWCWDVVRLGISFTLLCVRVCKIVLVNSISFHIWNNNIKRKTISANMYGSFAGSDMWRLALSKIFRVDW